VTGDTVSNMDLRAAVKAHRARREKDKLAIMTMVRAQLQRFSVPGAPAIGGADRQSRLFPAGAPPVTGK